MTIQTTLRSAAARVSGPVIAAVLITAAVTAPATALLTAPAPACHVGPAAGAYTCQVAIVVDPAASASPSAGPTATAPGSTPSASPASTATPVPTPTATSSPTPAPTPSPTSTPGLGVQVPSSIDSTGRSDVSAVLAAFLNSLPANTTVQFRPGTTYALASAVKLGGRVGLDLEGNGATLRATGAGTNENFSLLYWQTFPGTNRGDSVHGFNLAGNDPTPGTFVGGKEGAMGVLVDGGSGFDIAGNTFSGSWGDAVEVNSGASGVHIHGNTVTTAGRNAVSVIWGNHVEIDHNTIAGVGYVVYDVEPNTASEPSSFVSIHDNASGTWSDAWLAVDGSSTGAAISDISVVNNVSTGRSLLTIVASPAGRKQRVTLQGNRSNVAAAGPVFRFAHVDGLLVTGNAQPLTSGALVSVSDCPGAITSPNP